MAYRPSFIQISARTTKTLCRAVNNCAQMAKARHDNQWEWWWKWRSGRLKKENILMVTVMSDYSTVGWAVNNIAELVKARRSMKTMMRKTIQSVKARGYSAVGLGRPWITLLNWLKRYHWWKWWWDRQSIQLKQEIIQRLAGPWITSLNWLKKYDWWKWWWERQSIKLKQEAFQR